MGFVYVDPEVSCLGNRVRVGVKCSVRCMSRIGLRLHLGLGSDEREAALLNDSVTVRYG